MNIWEMLWIQWGRKVVTVDVAGVSDKDDWGKGGVREE